MSTYLVALSLLLVLVDREALSPVLLVVLEV